MHRGSSNKNAVKFHANNVLGDEIVVTLFSRVARRSSGVGQILYDDLQLSPREAPIFHKRQRRMRRHLQGSLKSRRRSCFIHCVVVVISAGDSKMMLVTVR